MSGVSSLNTNNSMVIILEQEFENVRKLLMTYTRLHVQSLIIFNICATIFCLSVLGNIPLLVATLIFINLYMNNTLRKLHKECNLKQVGKIAFGQDYDIYDVNISDVYYSTRELSCMKGKLQNAIYVIHILEKIFIVMAIIAVVWAILAAIVFNNFFILEAIS